MASRTVGNLFVVPFLISSALNPSAQTSNSQDVPQKPSWALEVMTFESTKPTFLWVGVLNGGEARLACIFYRGIGFTAPDGTNKQQGSGGSPHACDAADQFQLVHAGQTLFTQLTLPKGLTDKLSGKIRVELSVVDRPAKESSSRREPVGLTWEGTLQEAADRGRVLTGAAPGRK